MPFWPGPGRDIGAVRHERRRRSHVGDPFRSGAVRKMEDCWPSSAGPRGQALNHPELRWLKTVVVSVREKAWLDHVRWGSGRRARSTVACGGVAVEAS
jgi:hypothetical protein